MSRSRTLLVIAAATLIGLSSGVSAQGAPSLSVAPERPDPGDEVTVTVDECQTMPTITYAVGDTVATMEPTQTGQPNQWQLTIQADQVDGNVSGSCGDVTFDPVIVDVENPLLSFLPQGSNVSTPSPPTTVYGTDCPDGSRPFVGVVVDGRPYTQREGSPIDAQGDWSAPLGAYPAGATVEVSADCDEVGYRSLTFTVPADPTATATTSTTTTPTVVPPPSNPPPVPPATPARPRTGSADFTG